MNFEDRSKKLWEQVALNEHSKYYLNAVFENIKDSSKVYTQSYYAILVFAVIYWFLKSGNIQEFKFFDFNISDISTLEWAIPVIMSYLFYQGIGAFVFEAYCLTIIDNFMDKHLPEINVLNLREFAYPLSFFNMVDLTPFCGHD